MKPKTNPITDWMEKNAPVADDSDIGILICRCMIEELRGTFRELDDNPTHLMGYLAPWNRKWGEPFTKEDLELMIANTPAKEKQKRAKKPPQDFFGGRLLEEE